uniref:Dynein regulatory complex subunit 4 n=1 Tax=Anser brachyrhynchus TaxID=132585 RepID=A0A8B9BDL2_9AVES
MVAGGTARAPRGSWPCRAGAPRGARTTAEGRWGPGSAAPFVLQGREGPLPPPHQATGFGIAWYPRAGAAPAAQGHPQHPSSESFAPHGFSQAGHGERSRKRPRMRRRARPRARPHRLGQLLLLLRPLHGQEGVHGAWLQLRVAEVLLLPALLPRAGPGGRAQVPCPRHGLRVQPCGDSRLSPCPPTTPHGGTAAGRGAGGRSLTAGRFSGRVLLVGIGEDLGQLLVRHVGQLRQVEQVEVHLQRGHAAQRLCGQRDGGGLGALGGAEGAGQGPREGRGAEEDSDQCVCVWGVHSRLRSVTCSRLAVGMGMPPCSSTGTSGASSAVPGTGVPAVRSGAGVSLPSSAEPAPATLVRGRGSDGSSLPRPRRLPGAPRPRGLRVPSPGTPAEQAALRGSCRGPRQPRCRQPPPAPRSPFVSARQKRSLFGGRSPDKRRFVSWGGTGRHGTVRAGRPPRGGAAGAGLAPSTAERPPPSAWGGTRHRGGTHGPQPARCHGCRCTEPAACHWAPPPVCCQAPKKAGRKGKGGKAPAVADASGPEEMSREQLGEHIVRLRQELDREREERNYFQLERDKIHTFWEITRRQLEEKKAELRNKDREMEEAEERHQVEIKVYKQKVKHLLYEHQENLTELKAEGTLSMKRAQKDHWAQEMELRKDMRSLKVELKEQELANEVAVKNMRLKQEEEITRLCNDFERQVKEIEAKYSKKMQVLRDELDLRRKTEIHEVEERKNNQISELMKNHEKAFSEIKNYYNDITLKNLALISLLKEQMEEMKKRENQLEKEKADVLLQNKQLKEPLQQAQEQVSELQKKLAHYDMDKEALTNTKARLKVIQKELKDLQWEHEVLEQRFSKVQAERDELYQKFTKAINEVQQKTGFKNLLLERKLKGLLDILEKKEVELSEVFAASNLDPGALSLVSHKLEDVLKSKNTAIEDLQFQLARVCKAHNDMLQTLEAKLTAFGIPLDNLGFKPLESPVLGQTLGQGPAGLVAVPT